MSELAAATVRLTANIDAFGRTIAERLLPVMEEFNRELRRWYNSWPGMPYTAPSLWDASQMAADYSRPWEQRNREGVGPTPALRALAEKLRKVEWARR